MRPLVLNWYTVQILSSAVVLSEFIKANPLPAPQEIEWNVFDPIEIDPFLSFSVNKPNLLLEGAFNRCIESIFQFKWQSATWETPTSQKGKPLSKSHDKKHHNLLIESMCNNVRITDINFDIDQPEASLQMEVDESYSLFVKGNSSSIQVSAATTWGALHALTTLGQIVFYDQASERFYIELSVSIKDWPLYPHRGVLIDSGRNYLSVGSILDNIDIMSMAKMNVLHWHLVDSQSWPIKLEVYPEMVNDAYSDLEIYSKLDIEYVISYAKQRGVRVIPELDMPGHSRAGYLALNKSILACEDSWWSGDIWLEHTAVEPPPGQLEILKDETYDVVGKIYTELSEIFPDNIFHVGGDELQANCYKDSTTVRDWFCENENRTFKDLTQHWIDRAVPIFKQVPERRLMMWEDVITSHDAGAHHVSKDVIVQSWSNFGENIQNLTNRGYDVVVSSHNFLYLDCGYGGWLTNDPRYSEKAENDEFNYGQGGSWCGPYKTWQRIYGFNIAANLTAEQQKHILGAEAALWGEQTDSIVLIQNIWPRTAALAENLWSGNVDPETGDLRTFSMVLRILNFREYLVALGYSVSPLVPRFCLQNPHACDLLKTV